VSAIATDHLSKWYGQVSGLNDVTVSVPPGITGLLGPNGAGKSTFMKLVTGQIKPSKGSIRVLGEPIWENHELYRRIGFCPEQDAFYDRMTGLEWVSALVGLNGFSEQRSLSCCFLGFEVLHPFWMISFLVLTSVTFSLLGFLIGIWADSWEKIQIVPMMVVTPLTFLGGSFYSISMLPPVWQKITLFNPVVYLINGFRWSFYGKSDVNVVLSVSMTFLFMLICLSIITWMFRTGYKLKN